MANNLTNNKNASNVNIPMVEFNNKKSNNTPQIIKKNSIMLKNLITKVIMLKQMRLL